MFVGSAKGRLKIKDVIQFCQYDYTDQIYNCTDFLVFLFFFFFLIVGKVLPARTRNAAVLNDPKWCHSRNKEWKREWALYWWNHIIYMIPKQFCFTLLGCDYTRKWKFKKGHWQGHNSYPPQCSDISGDTSSLYSCLMSIKKKKFCLPVFFHALKSK